MQTNGGGLFQQTDFQKKEGFDWQRIWQGFFADESVEGRKRVLEHYDHRISGTYDQMGRRYGSMQTESETDMTAMKLFRFVYMQKLAVKLALLLEPKKHL